MRYELLLFLYGWLLTAASGQTIPPDSSESTAQYALARYQEASSNVEQLYNGIEYIGYDTRLKVHPYFASDSFQTGFVQHGGKTFSVPMLYDIVSDVIVVRHPSAYRVALQSAEIESFSWLSHTYVRLLERANPGLTTGFYDLLYTGPSQLLARRIKTIQINTTSNGDYGVFDPKTTYYIRKKDKDRYYPVKNKKMVLEVLSDRKKELVAYARKQKLRFRPDPEQAIIKLTQQYDELNKPL